MNNKINTTIYNNIINDLMKNDSNSSIDTLLLEVEYNYIKAINILKSCLLKSIEETEGEEKFFYKNNLDLLEENYKEILW